MKPPTFQERRALKLLAACPEGCAEGALEANGFKLAVQVNLIAKGLARARWGRILAGRRELTVATLFITDLGRRYV